MRKFPARRSWTVLAVVTVAVTVSVDFGIPAATAVTAGESRYVVAEPICASGAAGHVRCLGERLLRQSKFTPGARALPSHASATAVEYATGPAGGYTPADLAGVYKVNPDAATTQTVAVVDAYDDPNALSDLNAFDAQYGLAAETATSFRKVSQTGSATSLPQPNSSWAGEESLDLDAVRGVCHKCGIVLVEADSDADDNLAAAENEAVALGAHVVTNSFGEPETGPITTGISTAFDHPGVVITAGTGDDGMYSWDQSNAGTPSTDAPYFPASLSTVVAVGGTTLELADDGTRSYEGVWNENGEGDYLGAFGLPFGATGGGCSTQVTAPRWQYSVTGYSQTTCGTKRLPADISALADPFTGFDVYDSYQSSGWQTVGGTSLSSPLVAAMWALAGGGQGVRYPALTLYGHSKTDPTSSVFDITDGGNGYCDGLSAADCESYAGQSPNTLGYGQLDCAFLPNSETEAAGTRACDAAPGYDGPSGVGTPAGVHVFGALNPTPRFTTASKITTATAASFEAASSSDPFPGGSLTAYRWTWGDGTAATGANPVHRYTRTGTYTVTLTVTDNFRRTAAVTHSVKVTAASRTAQSLTSSKVRTGSRAKTTVRVSAVGATPTGTVTIFDAAKAIRRVLLPLSAHGALTITLPKLRGVGVHRIHAEYSGSTYIAGSEARPVELAVTS